jgi:CBS-domain-containing membrane protein
MKSTVKEAALSSSPEDFLEDVLITGEGVDALLDAPAEIVMRYPNCVNEDTPLEGIPELFLNSTARALVVVDERQRPRGIVTPAHLLRAAKFSSKETLHGATVRDVATSCSSLPDSASLRAAAHFFVSQDKNYLVIVNDQGSVVGMLTAADVLNAVGAWSR